jgi:hypothetical protein
MILRDVFSYGFVSFAGKTQTPQSHRVTTRVFSLFFCFKKGRKNQSPEYGGFGPNRQCSQGKAFENHDEPYNII